MAKRNAYRKHNAKVKTKLPTTTPEGYREYQRIYQRERKRRLNNIPPERYGKRGPIPKSDEQNN